MDNLAIGTLYTAICRLLEALDSMEAERIFEAEESLHLLACEHPRELGWLLKWQQNVGRMEMRRSLYSDETTP